MFDLTGKVALVTGASRGIGKAIAMQLIQQGATVVGTATSDKGAQAISDYIKDSGNGGKGMTLNVTDDESISQVLKAMTEEFGAPDILINNAGITRDNLIMRMKDSEWDDIMHTNLNSVFKLSKAVMRGMMKKKNGRIVSVGSVVGSTGNGGQANYAAAKAAVIGFSKSMAREIASRGITVNVVSPGFIDTDMTRSLSNEQKEAIFSDIPANRLGQPEEIAAAVAFLCSDAAAYITGETLHVNGGMHMA